MVKRVYIAIGLLLIMVLSISGCGKSIENNSSNTNDKKIEEVTYDLSTFKISGDGLESQSYWNSMTHAYAADDSGYYHAGSDMGSVVIQYIDKETHQAIPLCDKPDCEHNGSSCNAWFPGYLPSSVWRYKDYVYVIKYANGQAILTRCGLDGNNREELFEIGELEERTNIYRLTFCNDCVYIYTVSGNYSMNEVTEVTLRRRSLDGKGDSSIYSTTDKNTVIQAVKCYGNQVFFMVENLGHSEGALIAESHGVFVYNDTDKTIGQLLDYNVSDYIFDYNNNQLYYYVFGEGLYIYDFNTKNTNKLYDADESTALCQISVDSQHIYISNERWNAYAGELIAKPKLLVLDRDGTLVNNIKTGFYATYFGDESNLMFKIKKSKGSTLISLEGMAYIDKSKVDTVDTWTEIK